MKGATRSRAASSLEYSGEDDFDQINVQPIPGGTNNQNGRFEFTTTRPARHRARASRTRRSACSPTTPRSASARFTKWRALATDVFVQDSWKPTSNLTIEGGIRWAFWPPWYSTDQQHRRRSTRASTTPPTQAVDRPGDAAASSRGAALQRRSCCPATGSPATASEPGRRRRSGGATRCSAALPAGSPRPTTNAFEPRSARAYASNDKTIVKVSAGIFHNRVTLNDSTAARRQPAVPAAGQRAATASPTTRAARRRRDRCRSRMTAQDPEFKHPTAYMWSAGRAARGAVRLRRRRRPTSAGAGCTCSASATSTSCCRAPSRRTPASTSPRCGPTRATASSGCRRTPGARSTTACRSAPIAATRTASSSASAYTLGKSEDNAQRQARRAVQHLRRLGLLGRRRASIAATCSTSTTSTTCRSAATRPAWSARSLGGWQISGATFMRTGTPLWVTPGRRHRRHRRHASASPGTWSATRTRTRTSEFSAARARTRTSGSTPRPSPSRPAARFGNGTAQQHLPARPVPVGHRVLQERQPRRDAGHPVPRRDLQLPEPPEPVRRQRQRLLGRRRDQPDERRVRPRHRQGQRAAGHSAEPEVPLLAVAPGG